MSPANEDATSPAAVRARAEEGNKILGSTYAKGEPGEKQPAHNTAVQSAKETVEQIEKIQEQFSGETYKSSAERSKQSGNLNEVPPHERTMSRGPQILAAADQAAGALGAARDAITNQLVADARIASDPRYERDQLVYELGATGKLAGIKPAPAEAAMASIKAGVPPEVQELVPKTAEEQVAQDMPRLEEQKEKPTGVAATVVPSGEQDSADKNNGKTAQDEGKTGDEAVARTKQRDGVSDSGPGTPIK